MNNKEKVTPEVILEKLEGMRSLFLEKFSENAQNHYDMRKWTEQEFSSVKEKQDHTNGDITALKAWRNRFAGAFAVISMVFLPIGIYAINQLVVSKAQANQTKEEVKKALEEILNNKD